ncbi:prepilin-type N-terminal cleavage/methylation domain-containing protein [Limnohabitans sp.]|uniref:prepilin-type N-terminal cleavage/methylation domain-containing protein n=1 Tax=Limnohabitans sp. TaxID=1907725 RepID=UPI0038B8112B
MQRQRGLTLLELLVVLAIIGLTLAGVALSLRNSPQTQLELETQRLIAHLEAARAQSRTSGMPLVWRSTPTGYAIDSAQPASRASNPAPTEHRWLIPGMQASPPATQVVLGPEPIIAPASITLVAPPTAGANAQTRRLATDGLRPFEVQP